METFLKKIYERLPQKIFFPTKLLKSYVPSDISSKKKKENTMIIGLCFLLMIPICAHTFFNNIIIFFLLLRHPTDEGCELLVSIVEARDLLIPPDAGELQ
jgi:hypothetical protein